MRLVEIDDPRQAVDAVKAQGLSQADLMAEEKYNGWLAQAASARLYSRRGHDLTQKFPEIARAIACYQRDHLLGELVYWTPQGQMDVRTVTMVAGTKDPKEAVAKLKKLPGRFEYILFGAIATDDFDISPLPTADRRAILEEIYRPAPGLEISPVYPFEKWEEVYDHGVAEGGDGVVLKNAAAPYLWRPLGAPEARPYGNQFKLKPISFEDFVVYEWFRGPRGKLIVRLGQFHKRRLIPVSTMNNFSKAMEAEIAERLEEGPFVMEVAFQARFPEPPGALQHPRFERFRDDKAPKDATLPASFAP